jgi:hypothetical protein
MISKRISTLRKEFFEIDETDEHKKFPIVTFSIYQSGAHLMHMK